MLKLIKQTILRFGSANQGMAAVEFAIGAPVLLLGLVIVTDIGLAIRERMVLDQAVRAGADFAMTGADEPTIENMTKAAARGVYGTQQGDGGNNYLPVVDATQSCECPANGSVAGYSVTCGGTTLCTGDIPPSTYWQIAATRNFNGLLFPDFVMNTEIQVQVR